MRAPFVPSSSLWLLFFVVACGAPPAEPGPGGEPALQRSVQALGEGDGTYGSGIDQTDVYGSSHQGRSLTGEAASPLLGIDYRGVTLHDSPVLDVRIVRGRLIGRIAAGGTVHGAGWVGAIFQGRVSESETIALKITGVNTPLADLDLYTVLRLDTRQDPPAPTPLCAPDAEGKIQALAVAARWNRNTGDRVPSSDQFTFACRSGVISKCVGWGYAPWPEQERAAAMMKAHQACTRAARADYCANGRTHTRDGTEIGIFDRLQPPVRQDSSTALEFEGAWNDKGAHCLTHLRWERLTPECPMGNGVSGAVGPYLRDPAGSVIARRICDSPEEALAIDPSVVIFTESVTHSLAESFDLGLPGPVGPAAGTAR